MSLEQIEAALCAPGQPFEIETVDVGGIPTRCWKNAPPSLAALAHAARTHGDKTFIVYEDERVSYEGWFRATAILAQALQTAGIGKGDRVALAMRNLPEWPVAFFAIVSLGAIAVPLNAWWTGGELAYGIADSGAKLLIADAERVDRLAPHLSDLATLESILVSRSAGDIPPHATRLEDVIGLPGGYGALEPVALPDVGIAPDDAATIFYTSGTTGNPKGALGSHRNMTTNILTTAYAGVRAVLRRGETPPAPEAAVMLTVIPLFHVTACSAGMTGIMFGGSTMVFMHKWDTQKALQIIERERVTATGGVPTIAWQLIEHPDREKYDLSSLKSISYGGAPSAPELVRKIREVFGALPGNGWGMTETMATVTSHSAEDYLNRPDSCGPAVPVSDLKIMDADGQTELPPGEVGELWARGPQIVKGYWNKPAETAATFVDGWVRTGDLARLDEEGFCYIVDRAKDMIIRGGENIYSSEVENVLYDHPAVTDAALIGLPHRTLGEEPAAVVHLAPGSSATEAELQSWVRERLAAFKVPVRIVFCEDTLPRNANGKILKKDLAVLFG
ncbi:class I adenylate-forming enzyme family protein [Blastomonas sp.]|uniref:class I adenylate-forming enzyme family protein n=1 Tax=Blastomonas sp. TaxID=1909299 RepID=UPI002619ED37|nr:class I adenylate-forming enzyme family protein [Blastomonas sp.]MDM7956711.1 class I adenylate-forming enzyme family protein [Blastomonas sp.]